MAALDLINLSGLLNALRCFAFVRQPRWPESACCPDYNGVAVIGDGYDDTQPHRQRDRCAAEVGSDAPVRDARRGMSRRNRASAEVMR